jgi:hypothetical protein
MREESKKAKQKKTKDFLRAHVLARFFANTYVRRLSESSHHHHHKSKNTTMESLSPLTLLGSSSAHPPTKKQRKEGMCKLL